VVILQKSNGGDYEIEINSTGEAARFRLYSEKVTRWRQIQHTTTGRAFAILNGRREHLENYLRF